MNNTSIKDYYIKSELGRGGMATVYLAHDDKFDTDVAIKVLNKEFVHNENIRKRFLAEARSMAHMSHPNIIKVTDLVDEDDTVAFVMEYVEGETLKEYIDRKGKLKDHEIIDIFSQMLDALAYVHEQKLIHRDIKPSNFMVDTKGKMKLMDFGIAKNTDKSSAEYTITGTNQSMGTPMYMSPEQVKSTKDVTLQSDIYSLGVVLWNMVTGRKPYDAETSSTFDLQTKIVNEKLPLTATIFDVIIERATEKGLEKRYESCNEVKIKLENLHKQDNESTKAYTSQNSEKTIIETAADQTIIEKPKQIETQSSPEIRIPYKPQVQKSNSNIVFIILGILLIIGLGIAISNKSDYDETEDISFLPNETQEQDGNIVWESSNNGYFIDPRDNNKYRVVRIENQVWMVDNLKFSSSESVSYRCDETNDINGRLYNWDDAKEVSPKGWHLPSKSEYEILLENMSESKMFDEKYFNAYSAGNAFFGTERCNDEFPQFDDYITYWTSTSYGNEVAWALIHYEAGLILTWDSSYRKGRTESGCYYGIRCILD